MQSSRNRLRREIAEVVSSPGMTIDVPLPVTNGVVLRVDVAANESADSDVACPKIGRASATSVRSSLIVVRVVLRCCVEPDVVPTAANHGRWFRKRPNSDT